MASSKQIRRLATRPQDMMRFQLTGKLPQGVKPHSPLLDLLDRIPPRDRIELRGLTIDPRLGYAGSRIFANAEQAMRWLRPDDEMFEPWPAESWRIKMFSGPIQLATLLECAPQVPEPVVERLQRVFGAARGGRPPRP
jgi:hypothetical protein